MSVRKLTWTNYFVSFFSALILIAGVFSIIGWTMHWWLPHSMLIYLNTIKPITAICFILCALSLWIYNHNDNAVVYLHVLAEVCAATVFLLSFLTLFQYFFQINLGIDEGFFKGALVRHADIFPPGRMPPLAATSFALIGFVLFFLDSKVISYRIHQALLFLVISSVFLSFLIHLYGTHYTSALVSIDRYSQMPLSIIMLLLILSIAIFFVRSHHGVASLIMSKGSGGVLIRRLIPPAVILPIIFGYIGLIGIGRVYYEAELGISLLVMATIIFFVILIVINAYLVNDVDRKRKRIEEELELNRANLQAVLDNTSSMIYSYDMAGRYLLVNKQFEKLSERNAAQITGKSPYEIFDAEVAEKNFNHYLKVIESGSAIQVEELFKKSNEKLTYLSNFFPLYNEEGQIYSVGAISTDISEIQKIQSDLKENKENLDLALKSAHAGTWSWNIENNMFIWDDYMYELFDLEPGSIALHFKSVMNLIHPEDRKTLIEKMERSLQLKGELISEFRIIDDNNAIRYLNAKGQVYQDANGKVLRLTGICWDSTQAHYAEEELRNAKEMAEKLALQAAEASHAKSAFLAAMSHEIRTPLNAVIGMTELMLDTKVSEDQREQLETVRVSSEALLSIINDILDFSKIESDRMLMESIEFDLFELIQNIIDGMAPEIHQKGVALGVNIETNVPQWLVGDPTRLQQILVNLLNNAAKFTEKGEISVKVMLIEKNNNEVTLLFEVIDTGIGIAADVKERLFKPFTQGDISTSRKYGGTGLGLAISKRLVEMMGGNIEVESLIDRGSKFWFTLKLIESEGPSFKNTFQLAPEFHYRRLLCIDDNAINRDAVKKLTQMWNLACDTAVNAGEGLSLLKKSLIDEKLYDLVLVDYEMPGMDGLELIEIMHQLNGINQIPVILLVSLGTKLNEIELKKYGIFSMLNKPIKEIKLFEAVNKALQISMSNVGTGKKYPDSSDDVLHKKNVSKILIVEDSVINQQVLVRMLERLGYQPDVVNNGKEAISIIQANAYDLILMDCQMPEMDGYTATEKIREFEKQNFKSKHTPIVAFTAHALRGDREKCYAAGMDDYISKPVTFEQLTTTLSRWLGTDVNTPAHDRSHYDLKRDKKAKVLDMERLRDILGNNTDIIKEFIKIFIHSTEDLLQSLDVEIKNKNKDRVKDLFHRLKGSAGNSGIMSIYERALQAEEEVSKENWLATKGSYDAVLVLFAKIKDEVEEDLQIKI